MTSADRLESAADAGHDHPAKKEQDPRTEWNRVLEGPQHPDEGERRRNVREDVSSILHGASLSRFDEGVPYAGADS